MSVAFPCNALLISHTRHILLMLFKTQRATDQTEHDKCTCCIPSLCPAASQTLCNEHHRAPMHSCKCHVFLHDTGAQRGQSNHGQVSHIRNIALITMRKDQGVSRNSPRGLTSNKVEQCLNSKNDIQRKNNNLNIASVY